MSAESNFPTRLRVKSLVPCFHKTHRVNLAAVLDRDQDEPCLLIANLADAENAREVYSNRFWPVLD